MNTTDMCSFENSLNTELIQQAKTRALNTSKMTEDELFVLFLHWETSNRS